MKTVSLLLFLVIAMLVSASVTAQTSSFTYQGQLKFNGTPVNGVYDFMFRLMNDPVNGTAAPVIPINPGVIVSNGIFTTGMDFGMENFAAAICGSRSVCGPITRVYSPRCHRGSS